MWYGGAATAHAPSRVRRCGHLHMAPAWAPVTKQAPMLPGCASQLLMGGKKYSISPDEYVMAALSIYLVRGSLQPVPDACSGLGWCMFDCGWCCALVEGGPVSPRESPAALVFGLYDQFTLFRLRRCCPRSPTTGCYQYLPGNPQCKWAWASRHGVREGIGTSRKHHCSVCWPG
jgi:hypothetical protein